MSWSYSYYPRSDQEEVKRVPSRVASEPKSPMGDVETYAIPSGTSWKCPMHDVHGLCPSCGHIIARVRRI